MTRSNWEQKLLGNLAGRVHIDLDEHDLLVRDGLKDELTKVQKTSSDQTISIGKKDLALQALRLKSKGYLNDSKAHLETIRTLKQKLKEKAMESETDVAERAEEY